MPGLVAPGLSEPPPAGRFGQHNIGFIQYDDFDFGIEHVTKWEQRAVYSDDGVDFLYFAVDIEVVAVFNPAGVSTKIDFGAWAPETILAIRQQVLTPRKRLLVRVGDVTVIDSPRLRDNGDRHFETDCKNGPQPISFDVLQIYGPKTCLCRFRVQTWVSDCTDAIRPALLSHRWETVTDIDDRFYSTVTTRGTAHFRTDYLLDDPVRDRRTPDNFRAWLVGGHPIPNDFRREKIRVAVSSDGTRLHYETTDVQHDLNLGRNNPVQRIKGHWTHSYDGIGFWSFLPQGRRNVSVEVECWGKRTSSKTELMRACLTVAVAFGLAPGGLFDQGGVGGQPPSYFNGEWYVSLDEKYVRLNLGLQVSGTFGIVAGSLLVGALSKADSFANLQTPFPEDLPGVATASHGQNPRPTDGAYGTYVGNMVVAALNSPCTVQLKAADVKADTTLAAKGYGPLGSGSSGSPQEGNG